jgi:hypothetical protein
MNEEKEWEDLLDELEEESELNFGEVEPDDEEAADESFYASRLRLIEEAARRVKGG